MGIGINGECMACLFQRNVDLASTLGDEQTVTRFARELMELFLTAPEGVSAPWFAPKTNALLQKHFGLEQDRFHEEKIESNRYVLARMDRIRSMVLCAEDSVYAALQLAVLGNYIDFASLREEVSFDRLDTMLENALDMELDRACYDSLCRDLAQGKKLLYLTDNAGELGFDLVLAEQLSKAYPHLEITFCVRGGPAQNDATREDAGVIGIPFPIIDNGTCIPGTELGEIGIQARRAMEGADVILSKGQGNAETLLGCGYHVYYAFLVKCPRFMKHFQKPKLTPMLVKEL